jgi:hypothetical protein
MLADHGITHLELESIPWWWDDGAHREESDRVRYRLLEAAEQLHPRHLKVTPDGNNAPWDRGVWAAASRSWPTSTGNDVAPAILTRMPGAMLSCEVSPQTFCGKPSSMPPWLGSSQREVTTLPRV